jgi:hypothetical protein
MVILLPKIGLLLLGWVYASHAHHALKVLR